MAAIDSEVATDAPTPGCVEIDGFRCYAPVLALELYSSSFVTTLFPAMVASRLLSRRRATKTNVKEAFASEVTLPPVASRLCDWVMRIDELALRAGISLPFGRSLLVVARKSCR